ncbi:hypothetical protein C2E23DRAFT_382768 [Lenzites betulinus]|nr:hypothetical protein C2E23DRAFT_382768 [Lenzites betulinus]
MLACPAVLVRRSLYERRLPQETPLLVPGAGRGIPIRVYGHERESSSCILVATTLSFSSRHGSKEPMTLLARRYITHAGSIVSSGAVLRPSRARARLHLPTGHRVDMTFSRGKVLLAVLVVSAAPAWADFHIFDGTNGGDGYAAKAVPSNHYSCLGWRGAPIVGGLPSVDSSTPAFSVQDLCGVAQLNFYNNGAGFDVYVDGGNGTTVGACSAADGRSINGGSACPDGYAVFDEYVCLSYVCA